MVHPKNLRRDDFRVVRGPEASAGLFYVQLTVLSTMWSVFAITLASVGTTLYWMAAYFVSRLNGHSEIELGPAKWIMLSILFLSIVGAVLLTRRLAIWYERRTNIRADTRA